MHGRLLALLAGGALVAVAVPIAAQDGPIRPAAPGSVEARAGEAILNDVGGRTLDQAGGDRFNPFGIDGEALLLAVGAFFVTTDHEDGVPVHEGELSIFPQFDTPLAHFERTAATPGIIPFALLQKGVCHGGFVAGYPVPDTIYAVDMNGQICHAAIVEEIVYADYEARTLGAAVAQPETEPEGAPRAVPPRFDPASPLDIELDLAVWAAYKAAHRLAIADSEFLFMRDGNFDALRDAILAELEKEGLGGIEVPTSPAPGVAAAFGCAPAGRTELRVALTADNAGITLVAASSRSVSSYRYNPDESADLDIDRARECQTEGLGHQRTRPVR